MDFNEAFWLATAAVAPLITVANLVAVGDSLSLSRAFKDVGQETITNVKYITTSNVKYIKMTEKAESLASVVFWFSSINILVQAVVTAVALQSLATKSNYLPLGVVVLVEFFGLLNSMFIAQQTGNLRYAEKKLGEIRINRNSAGTRPPDEESP